MSKTFTLFFLILLTLSSNYSFAQDSKKESTEPESFPTINSDSSNFSKSLSETIIGGLLFLDKKQVKDRRYRTYPSDFARDQIKKPGISCILRSFAGSYLINGNHLKGNWPGFVDFMPERIDNKVQPWFTAIDYNAFVTTSTALCLRHLCDTLLPPDKQFLSHMKQAAVGSLNDYRRNETVNFWPVTNDHPFSYSFSQPANIPLTLVKILEFNTRLFGLFEYKTMEELGLFDYWLKAMRDKKNNPSGTASLFNIPNDSDDSSLVLALLYLYNEQSEKDSAIISNIMSFRDMGRKKADRHNEKIGTETGAFLTWQKNEDLPVFSSPERGIIPLATNNVDLVVNSNIILALGLSKQTNNEAFKSAVSLVTRAVKENLWKEVSIYYPEKLFFPLAISRAVKEADLHIPELDSALTDLTGNLIREQMLFEQKYPQLQGAFAPFDSINTILATAIGLNTLLNLGKINAIKAGMHREYEELTSRSVNFLLNQRREIKGHRSNKKQPIYFWPSGVLFASSIRELAYWYSDALTTALVIEALSQYALESKNATGSNQSKQLNICFENDVYSVE